MFGSSYFVRFCTTMLLLYVLLVFHTVLANYYPQHKEKVFYNLEDAQHHFQWFMQTHNKIYSDVEKEIRFLIFKENMIKINEMNRNDPHCIYAINQFADLHPEEFSKKHTGLRPELGDGTDFCKVITDADLNIGDAPAAFDWKDHIDIQIKNQKDCGSCWAFSATGNVEAQYAIKHNKSISLSEQQIVDCDSDHGCTGGVSAQALRYLIEVGGQETEEDYPYTSKEQVCQFSPSRAQVRVADCVVFNLSNEDSIREAVYKYGPLTAGVDDTSFAVYRGGVLGTCVNKQVGHAVMIVGYGRDEVSGKDYWMIKNSWGTAWGEDGFARIQRGVNCSGLLNVHIASSTVV